MNIKNAKQYIKDTVSVYLEKDSYGEYILPVEKQRPIFLVGAPGIGKTAIMEQVANELGIALVSYSMTHHTRQSALGLPFIVEKEYAGEKFSISEYTMSEIIASVYETMEKSGRKEGILFLDEINCVSETLAPAMLQFLQYKIFGRHKVPAGWIVVTAGNPPEYNNSVREFDIATWDRLKRMDVDPDYRVWKEYAYAARIHPAIITYLEIKKKYFYVIETTVDGKCFATARGWEDLSRLMQLYEKRNIAIDREIVEQYIQHPKIAKDFAVYYDLFNKYKSDYQVDSILDGTASSDIKNRAKAAKFDERISLLGLLLDQLSARIEEVLETEQVLLACKPILKDFRKNCTEEAAPTALLTEAADREKKEYRNAKEAGAVSPEQTERHKRVLSMLQSFQTALRKADAKAKPFDIVKAAYNDSVAALRKILNETQDALSHTFEFLSEAYGTGDEVLIFMTELTQNPHSSDFLAKYGNAEYLKYDKKLMLHHRQLELRAEIENLELDEEEN